MAWHVGYCGSGDGKVERERERDRGNGEERELEILKYSDRIQSCAIAPFSAIDLI